MVLIIFNILNSSQVMQFHFPHLGRWKWKRDNISICLITEQLLQRDVCSSHSHRRKSKCTLTLSSTFHVLLAQTQNISISKMKISFQGRNGLRTPQKPWTASTAETKHFSGGRCPKVMTPLITEYLLITQQGHYLIGVILSNILLFPTLETGLG